MPPSERGLIVVHEIPGRLRFSAPNACPWTLIERFQAAASRDRLRARLTYSRASERFLAEAPPRFPLKKRLREALRGCPTPGTRRPPAREAGRLAHGVREIDRERFSPGLTAAGRLIKFYLMQLFIPVWLKPFLAAYHAWPYIRSGTKDISRGKLTVKVLDGSAMVAALAMRDYGTASLVALLLDLGEDLEGWTREASRQSLTKLFSIQPKTVWLARNGVAVEIPLKKVGPGDRLVVRSGSAIPVDGVVVSGDALVNQASMTGEPHPVPKRTGLTVHAGTVVSEGTIHVEAVRVGSDTRFAKILKVIESSEGLKADIQSQAERLAERIVPYSFLLSLGVLLLTRDLYKAASVLLVDYSCALKLATPLAVKTAMAELSTADVLVKGGKHLENLARADVVVLDKTGTLTQAQPRVSAVYPLNGFKRDFVLRNAACLEEHFPHPLASAVVAQSAKEGLRHAEQHAEVQYILAHGIASKLQGRRILVGSKHFVSEDEGIDVSEAARYEEDVFSRGHSMLYVAVAGKLAGLIVIEDPLRPEAGSFIQGLANLGISRTVLLTGDVNAAARAVSEKLGIKEFEAQVLPDKKTSIIQGLQRGGSRVLMIGDGMNDSAALAYADVGVSMRHGADIAKEACDVLLLEGRLSDVLTGVKVSRKMMRRIRTSYGFVLAANSLFLGLGLLGLAPPALNAMLHNLSTVAVSLLAMRPYGTNGRPVSKAVTE